MTMPNRRGPGRPKKGAQTKKGPSVESAADNPPPGCGLSQEQWEALSPMAKVAMMNARAGSKPAAFDDGVPSSREPGSEVVDVSSQHFVPVVSDDVQEMLEINAPGVLRSGLAKISAVAMGGTDPLGMALFRDYFQKILKDKPDGSPLSSKEARTRGKELQRLIDALESGDAEFTEIVESGSCECLPDPAAVESEGPPRHFRRCCRKCGYFWASLHCPHDTEQKPCPGCLHINEPEAVQS